MDLNVQDWKEFKIPKLFNEVEIAKSADIGNLEEGDTPFVGRTDANNGIQGYVKPVSITKGKCISISMVGTNVALYQEDDFQASQNIAILRNANMSYISALFICTLINSEMQLKYSYGRTVGKSNIEQMILQLPVQRNTDGTPVIDADKTYSDEGYVPDWQFMEDYIKSLHSEPITTTRGAAGSPSLGVDKWKKFNLSDICHIDFGNKFDNDKMTHDEPSVNFVGRTADNNGVRDFVDKIDGVKPYQAGSITVALGGSIGSCFIQAKPFYTSQNVAVLSFDEKVSNKAKLFFANIFMYEVSGKFVAFGRELNKHMKTDFTMYLPVQCDANGSPVTDANDKYIPDWDFMERYIDSLPYSDKIA